MYRRREPAGHPQTERASPNRTRFAARCNAVSQYSALQTLQTRHDLAGLSVTADLRFLEDRVAVSKHLEPAPARWDQLHARVRKSLLDLGRQPGGPGLVVSERAVFDRDVHGVTRAEGARQRAGARRSFKVRARLDAGPLILVSHGIATPAMLASRLRTVSCLATTVRSESIWLCMAA